MLASFFAAVVVPLGIVQRGKVHGEQLQRTPRGEGEVSVVRIGTLADGHGGAAGVEGALAGGDDEVWVGVAAADAQAVAGVSAARCGGRMLVMCGRCCCCDCVVHVRVTSVDDSCFRSEGGEGNTLARCGSLFPIALAVGKCRIGCARSV